MQFLIRTQRTSDSVSKSLASGKGQSGYHVDEDAKSVCLPVCRYKLVLNSDDSKYGGHNRLDPNAEYFSFAEPWHDRPNSLLVRLWWPWLHVLGA